MNTWLRYKAVFIIFIFTCSLTAKAVVLYSAGDCPDNNLANPPDTSIRDLASTTGTGDRTIVNESKASALIAPVTIDKGGRMNLVSGHSITLKPGMRVIAGGYLHAAIVSDTKEQRPGTHKTRISGKTPDAEPVVAPVVIAETIDAISPFVKTSNRGISESDKKEESLAAQVSEVTGISPGQQLKLALHSTTRKNPTTHRFFNSCPSHFIPLPETHETVAVLRL
jgi:hypothetical protein